MNTMAIGILNRQLRPALGLALLLCLMTTSALPQDSYDQPWRPQYHFTPAKNFMNDPNGMVFYKGEYHLFYQHNPQGQVWGHMSWGHAVSTDMVHWQHLGLAIPEAANYMIYSGSAVVDWNNSSGLCKSADPKDPSCLIAIYAADYHQKLEKTHIAYSNDRGRTWTNYEGNPVIDVGAGDFRDPYVFWYEPQKKWVLAAVLADHRKALFFSSTDLKHWTKLSEFGPAGDTEGQWECPLLLELPVEATKETAWVLVINRNPGAPAGGTGVRYLIGHFDGTTFTENESAGKKLWADYGKDFYATNTFNDLTGVDPSLPPREGDKNGTPATQDERRVWMGWISNWLYAKDEPTVLWRGAQSIPRTLALRNVGADLLMVQSPVKELQALRGKPFHLKDVSADYATKKMAHEHIGGESYEIEAELEPGKIGEMGFRLRKSAGIGTLVSVVPATGALFVDRTESGDVSFSHDFAGRFSTTLSATARVKLHIFVDRSSVEVFANDGEKVMTVRIYPPPESTGIEIYSVGGAGKVISLFVWPLKSVWSAPK